MSDVTTWADGYGVWHARVPNTANAHEVARRAILDQLRQRGPISPTVVRCSVVRGSATAEDVTYVEDIP